MDGPRSVLVTMAALAFCAGLTAAPDSPKAYDRPEYLAIKEQLARGWGTWDSPDPLKQVHLPDGLAVGLSFKGISGTEVFAEPKMVTDGKGMDFRPVMHALDGSYSEAEINWKGTRLRVQSATADDDVVVLVAPFGDAAQSLQAVVTAEMLWGRQGTLSREPGDIAAALPGHPLKIYTAGYVLDLPHDREGTASFVLEIKGGIGVSTGRRRTLEQIESIVRDRRKALLDEAAKHGNLAGAYDAIRAAIGWSTIYDPGQGRVMTVVSRQWNQWFGGYVIFGWDNFFLPYACSLFGRDLAYANFAEHMRGLTPDGFIPNVEKTGGLTSLDRSEPPVASLMLKEIYKRYGDRWILEACFDDLLAWNRWWIQKRMNGTLLGWGSDRAANPLKEKDANTAVAAAWESGMDDSPMFAGVPFDAGTGLFKMQDVGLNGLYVADCRALAEIADVIGRNVEAAELRLRAEQFSRRLAALWNPSAGLYLNRRTDTGASSRRVSPTMFYPLIGRVPTLDRATEMVDQHLMNPTEFGGEYVIPSVPRNDPAFPTQHYWKGAVWPPVNFLVYLGLRNYNFPRRGGSSPRSRWPCSWPNGIERGSSPKITPR